MYKDVHIEEVAGKILEQLKKGAFLTVKSGDTINTMTIAWGTIGYIWHRPVFTAMVRPSRYTFDLIEKATSFTVSFPLNDRMRDALNLCGTKSGRHVDKFKECGLSLLPGKMVDTPIIDGCDIHLECGILYKSPLHPEQIPVEIKTLYYGTGDYHVLYSGEILAVRMKDED
ncbi:flavin reductase family protein [Thermosediminibacter litoriperuensis]|uniref:Flavin reductase (DIM6/NTAB) family NADH-FMN oxidoreductase RutF n=1 Tax=Thermosediminibacter litoriperuensis TaxID=291989 RepID=A0A5S5AYM4_9FIRM|nr:flavin reductase family protein [Thermosediminibacter litoriperuensis]TYP57464.1 flavin reductase (DIM6/NTAB) family NADH-FMN oxidoreductase RutF [Thermosediminibacter litoriperuensis]